MTMALLALSDVDDLTKEVATRIGLESILAAVLNRIDPKSNKQPGSLQLPSRMLSQLGTDI